MQTKKKLADALWIMLEKKELDKITVKDIVEESGVTRQTFYYHFQDMLDLMEWAADQDVQRALDLCREMNGLEVCIQMFMEEAKQRRQVIETLMRSSRRQQIEKIIIDAMRSLLTVVFEERGLKEELTAGEFETAVSFYAYALGGMAFEAYNQKDLNPELFARQLTGILKKKIF
ncbi:MAG: TetR family transcriptional regulator [Emergencia sp.]